MVDGDIQRSAAIIEDAIIAMKTYSMSASQDNYLKVVNLSKDLIFDFQEEGLAPEDRSRCVKQKFVVDSMKMVVDRWLQDEIGKMRLTLVQKEDCLIEDVTTYPIYLQKGVKHEVKTKYFLATPRNTIDRYSRRFKDCSGKMEDLSSPPNSITNIVDMALISWR